MKRIDWNKVLPHVIILVIFIITSMVYFYPALSGNSLNTHDIKMHKGMSKEIVDFRDQYGTEPLWTNSMFGGMPADQISVRHDSNLIQFVYKVYTLGLPRPISSFWAILIGFYILLMCLKVDPWLGLIGSLGFAFSSYFLVSLQAGHMSKINAISFLAPTLGGFILLFKGRLIEGGILATLFFSLLLWSGHPQITYYSFFVIGFVALYYLSKLAFRKDFKSLVMIVLVAIGVVGIGVSTSLASLWGTYEYSKETIRGKSDLTLETPDNVARLEQMYPDSTISKYKEVKDGLDNDYILAWSYGTGETFTFMFPSLKGGGNNYVPENTKTLEALYPSQFEKFQSEIQSKLSTTQLDEYLNQINAQYGQVIFPPLNTLPNREMGYYGQQRMTNGPVFIGVILCFLAFLGLVLSDGKLNYYLLGTLILVIIFAYLQNLPLTLLGIVALTALSVLNKRIIWYLMTVMLLTVFLGWGKNFLVFSEFFIDHFPMYNKFRAVTMILVIAELIIPLMAIIFLGNVFKNIEVIKSNMKKVYVAAGVFTFFIILVALNPSMFFQISDSTYMEQQIVGTLQQGGVNELVPEAINFFDFYKDKLYELRFNIIRGDALLALFFIAGISLLLFLYVKEKLNKPVFIGLATILVLIEMVPTSLKYLNNKKDSAGDYTYWIENSVKAYSPNGGDAKILEIEMARNPELNAEILTLTKEMIAESDEPLTENDKLTAALSLLNSKTDYRVFSKLREEGLTSSTRTSYFHKSLGGYHGAKLMRYQDLIDFHLGSYSKGTNDLVLDMLNTRYIIGEVQDEKGNRFITAQERLSALGEAWIVSSVNVVDSTNQEIMALYPEKGFDPGNVAVVNKEFKKQVEGVTAKDPNSSIIQTSYKPNELLYSFESSKDELVVFSEIYYPGGWQAYVDGKPMDHFRVNYLLRGMKVPAGKHEIKFEYKKKSFEVGSTISLISSSLVILLVLFYLYLVFSKSDKLKSELVDEMVEL